MTKEEQKQTLINLMETDQKYGMYDTSKEELRKRFDDDVSNFADGYPYKVAGRPDTYSDYNQGWSDASDILSQKLWDFFWAEIEKRDKEIDSWEEEVLKLGEETEKLEIKLIQYKNGLDIICTNYKKRIKELETQLSYYADKNQKQDE